MDLKDILIIKSDERGIIYDCGKSNFITRKKGSISADHIHEEKETIYLIKGSADLMIDNERQTVEAPICFNIPKNTYHKLTALTDIELVIDRTL